MGLLDDAIREHLDLKRRRGADPAEVARMEQEALGPVRREPVGAEAAADEHSEHHDEPVAADPHPHPSDADQHADDATDVLAPEDRHEPPHGDPLAEHHAASPELGGAAAREPQSSYEEPAVGERADRAGGGEDARPAAERRTRAQPEPTDHASGDAAPDDETRDPRHSDIVHQPTTEFRVEDHHDDEDEHAPSAEEDVLEETPDFLQETPEHDRLWFEQRPPRDFDFDG
jgi:hypothetical protein